MKRLISVTLLCAACLVACQESDTGVLDNAMVSNSLSQKHLELRLDSLSATYKSNSVPVVAYTPAKEDSEENKDTEELKKKQDAAEIAEKDMEGFRDGAAVGGMFGAAVGTLAGGSVGAAWGTIGGGALGGIGGAVIASVIEAIKQESSQINISSEEIGHQIKSEKDIYTVDLRSPILMYGLDSEWYFDNEIIGANVGYYHNYIISTLYKNNGKKMFDWPNEEIRDSTIEHIMNLVTSDKPEYVYEILLESTKSFGEAEKSTTTTPYINKYIECISDLNQTKAKVYTEEFMHIVQEEMEDKQEIMQINGAISTYFYSSRLWKSYMPSMYSGLYVCFNGNDSFLIETDDEKSIQRLTDDESLTFIGVPVIRDGQIESLFVFDDLRMLKTHSWNDYVIQLDNNKWELVIPNDVILYNHNTQYVISHGVYDFYRFDGGYVAFL